MTQITTLKKACFHIQMIIILLVDVAKNYPSIQEIELKDKAHYESLIRITNKDKDIIPLFIKDNNGELHIISSYT